MKRQRTDEWDHIDHIAYDYHLNQWDHPYESTKTFNKFISGKLAHSKNVVDLACGAGAPTSYLAKENPSVEFLGVDYSDKLVSIGKNLINKNRIPNMNLEQGDWFNLEMREGVDGVVSLQSLFSMPDYEGPLLEIMRKYKPGWIGITSLFYEGDITCWVEVEQFTRGSKVRYNTISIPAISRICAENGYKLINYEPFKIDIDLDGPESKDILGTRTMKVLTKDGNFERIQLSGPLLMSWYMLLIEKSP